ncbi:MAG: nitroreductase family protein [Armatimonadetes bacterium]|nr:nitroreductase family protein [Armatimonadota bacterium]NIM23603.1 nitroreductase family protein [Armatimonadota bacterium]NIM67469.1 nitroreductase family protein [Armatimonadota bacterium]NIM75966.1 nitroreductase family protein [Armatimonadota bacterium]NIN05655.1 nitroreductase family protein [Armatimonadota bacterium]
MDAIEAIKSRRSCREFLPDAVDKAVIKDIIDCARFAPTGWGKQPWEFVVVTDKAMRERIAEIAYYGRFIAQAPVCVAVYCRPTTFYLEDGCAATQNILLAATAHGLGSCWVGGDKQEFADKLHAPLGVEEDLKLICLIAIGHPAKPAGKAEKRPLAEVLHWEQFGRH